MPTAMTETTALLGNLIFDLRHSDRNQIDQWQKTMRVLAPESTIQQF